MESLLETYFSAELGEDKSCHWPYLESITKVPAIQQNDLIGECKSRGFLLTIYVIAGQTLCSPITVENKWKVALQIMGWLNDNLMNLTDENDYKLVLLWWRVLDGIVESADVKEPLIMASSLVQLSSSIRFVGEDRSAQGFLSFLGFGKKSPVSLKMRLMARAINVFVLKEALCLELKCKNQKKEVGALNIRKLAETAEDLLVTTTNNKLYESYKPLLEHITVFMNRSDISLINFKELFEYLITKLFLDKNCLAFIVSKS